MRTTILQNLLRYAVSRAIFCPQCENILDMDRAVLCRGHVVCDKCWPKALAPVIAKHGPLVAREWILTNEREGEIVFGKAVRRGQITVISSHGGKPKPATPNPKQGTLFDA